jgi:CRISPR-associated protein Csc3
VTIEGKPTVVNGLNLPILSEAISNTPVLPIVSLGANYGQQYMLALEKAVILVRWFECRAILTRSAIPPLNLSYETVDDATVVLMVDGRPRNLSWLIPQTSMTRQSFDLLTAKLCLLHQIAEKLYYVGGKNQDQSSEIPHDFAVAAADDVLALYFEADRWIEKKVATTKNMTSVPGHQAISLSKEVAPLLDALVKSSKGV